MALSPRSESELKRKANDKLPTTKNPVEQLRLKCLARGADGIRGLGRTFKIVDKDGNRQLSYSEFLNGINDFGLTMSKQQKQQLIAAFDSDGSGTIDFDEFLQRLRPPMTERRQRIVGMAFVALDRTGDGKITVDDLKDVYNVKHHKKYVNGEWTEDRCLREFLDSFDTKSNKDGVITKDEFLNYYSAVSASIDQDPYFDLMMRNAYRLTE